MTHTTLPELTKIRNKGYLFYFFGASYMREKGGGVWFVERETLLSCTKARGKGITTIIYI